MFVKFPRVLTASMKRLQERYEFLRLEGFVTESSRLTENKLRAIVLTNDSDFVYRITNSKMKEFRRFQRDLELKDTKEHEVEDEKSHGEEELE